ncbi:MAG: phytanoyl-CoA dioxygenase [Pseudomonadales bacterium]|nr:MAG: phytanoyl-CoA dioxygenase [Pseudomonadales bacterium]
MNNPQDTQDISKSIQACAAHYGENADAMRDYLLDGERKARLLNNRGPIRFDERGELARDIRDAYSEYGFYVFEDVIADEELEDIKQDLGAMRKTFPAEPNSKLTADGQPALGADCLGPNLLWAKPLGDPLGGTALADGRHQVKLFEPEAGEEAPKQAPFVLLGSLQFSEACLRVYGHPQLLRVAEAINGKDFAPFNESLFIKDPGIGAAVSWHQDGNTHWNSKDFDEGIHGFNFMVQVYGSTAVNGVWVKPGSHKVGKIDIKKLVEECGSERIDGMVPLLCNPGDAIICNRQILHGSFPNCGYEPRLTVNFGFHRRSSVLGVQGPGLYSEPMFYDEALIEERSKVIGYAIDARQQRFPDEQPYQYQPFVESGKAFHWSDAVKAELKDYNLLDLSI